MNLKLLGKIIAVLATVLIVALLLLILAKQVVFNGPPPGTGDPGNKRLNELANDAVFSILPPNAQLNGLVVKTPAQYRQPGFQPPGWVGPSVEIMFTSSESKAAIYQFYATRAAETGWLASANRATDGYIYSWTKTYSDSALASLILYGPDGGTYQLVGSVAAIDNPGN